jgi:hypothetical protein
MTARGRPEAVEPGFDASDTGLGWFEPLFGLQARSAMPPRRPARPINLQTEANNRTLRTIVKYHTSEKGLDFSNALV